MKNNRDPHGPRSFCLPTLTDRIKPMRKPLKANFNCSTWPLTVLTFHLCHFLQLSLDAISAVLFQCGYIKNRSFSLSCHLYYLSPISNSIHHPMYHIATSSNDNLLYHVGSIFIIHSIVYGLVTTSPFSSRT